MKELTILIISLVALVTAACAPPNNPATVKATKEGGYVSLVKYSQAGFHITPEGYDGPYETIAIMDVIIWPEAELETTRSGFSTTGTWRVEPVSYDNTISQVVDDLDRKGANAIINFQITLAEREVIVKSGKGARCVAGTCTLELTGVRLTGLGIKRLDVGQEQTGGQPTEPKREKQVRIEKKITPPTSAETEQPAEDSTGDDGTPSNERLDGTPAD